MICICMLLNIPYSIKLQILIRPSNVYKKTRRHPLFQSPFTPTFPARLKPFRYINLLYLMLWKQILEMDTTDVLAFSSPHPVVCLHFLGPFTPRVHIMLDPVVVSMERWGRCWHKTESQKGRSMQIQKKQMMTLQPQGLWFWLLRRGISFRSYVQWQARVLFTAPKTMGGHLFRDIALCNIYLICNDICYKLCLILN